MEVIQLLSFFQIVKTGSFSRAAENVFRSQSAVSHQIKNLEKDLNIGLFERLGKKVKLTEEGKILFDVVSNFLNDIDNLKRIYADIKSGHYGKLTIAITEDILAFWLLDVIAEFIRQFPGIKFKLVTSFTFQMQEMILNGEVDFGIGPKWCQL